MEKLGASLRNINSLQTQSETSQKHYVRPKCASLTPDQVRMRLANASPDDQQAQEWIARVAKTPKSGLDGSGLERVREQLRLALRHLSNAGKDCDLAGIIDALQLEFARDCVVTALRGCDAIGLDMLKGLEARPTVSGDGLPHSSQKRA
jgi:hypothetical protein